MSNEIFVFGSNLAGRHGRGSAKFAREHYGAIYGQGNGIQGNSYAIPTKDENLKVLSLLVIKMFVLEFLKYAIEHQEYSFKVVAIGCGLAGYVPDEIAPLFKGYPTNVKLPKEFLDVINSL